MDTTLIGKDVATGKHGSNHTKLGGMVLLGRWLAYSVLASALFLTGCDGVDRLINCHASSRSNDYEASQPYTPIQHEEPYALFVGYTKDGEKLYLIYWSANLEYNLQGMKEVDVDAMNIPKYKL